jgi:DNA-binding response OmpR family regulator
MVGYDRARLRQKGTELLDIQSLPMNGPTSGIKAPPSQQLSRQRLLLIDDDIKFCRLVAAYLTSHGYDVTTVHDGDSAVQIATDGTWNAIILDVMMPGMNGYEVLRKIRDRLHVPVLMLTALGDEETDRIVGLEIGADDYLPKSISPREILAHLRAVMRRTTRGIAEISDIVVGPLTINPPARTAELAGELLILTPVEFELLTILAQAKGRVKTREDLLSDMRDRDYDKFDRSIDVHISALRKKLQDDPKNPRFIRTVRSAGYMLIDPNTTSQ